VWDGISRRMLVLMCGSFLFDDTERRIQAAHPS
jgi:hypothetical protein